MLRAMPNLAMEEAVRCLSSRVGYRDMDTGHDPS